MNIKLIKTIATLSLLLSCGTMHAQDYVSPLKPLPPGKAPGMKVKQVSAAGNAKTYVIVFASGDNVIGGLTEFAQKYNVQCARYTGIGDAVSAKAGIYDYQRKQFKVIPIDSAEITSFIGNITVYNGKPVVHTHFSAATSDGIVHGGHLLQLIIGPTMEIFLTVEPTSLFKKHNLEFDAAVIDPGLTQ